MTVAIVRTHGGLGNQLFQVFYGRLLAEQEGIERLVRIHDARYKHGFQGSEIFQGLSDQTGSLRSAISALRIPKVLTRLLPGSTEVIRLPGTILIDGYFQRSEDYARFPEPKVAAGIARIRNEFGIIRGQGKGHLTHLRLGDFFTTEAAQVAHLNDRLDAIPAGGAIITNRDDLLTNALDNPVYRDRFEHIDTSDITTEDLVRLMARYAVLDTNDSTLAFWASLLSGSELHLSEERIKRLMVTLRAADAGSNAIESKGI
ncbi:hypothetical protein RN629_17120 [Sphingomonadaceae bacterium jetA1]|jgi:hypothetical protein|uniref:hypothetical protein n=1 Tax=Facivitalis istanbulensis TaxID=3075838 RepID=UPI00347F7202